MKIYKVCLYFCIHLRPLFPEGKVNPVGLLSVLGLAGLCPRGSNTAGDVVWSWVVGGVVPQSAAE